LVRSAQYLTIMMSTVAPTTMTTNKQAKKASWG
jgi:hypothetical protein